MGRIYEEGTRISSVWVAAGRGWSLAQCGPAWLTRPCSVSQVGDGYLAGKSFSLADVAVFPIFAYVLHYWYVASWALKDDLTPPQRLSDRPSFSPQCETRYPNVAAYYHRLKDRPSIKATWPPARFENPEGMEYIKDC